MIIPRGALALYMFASDDYIRFALNLVRFEILDGIATAVAINNHIMGIYTWECKGEPDRTVHFLAEDLARLVGKELRETVLATEGEVDYLLSGTLSLECVTLEEEFPNWRPIFLQEVQPIKRLTLNPQYLSLIEHYFSTIGLDTGLEVSVTGEIAPVLMTTPRSDIVIALMPMSKP